MEQYINKSALVAEIEKLKSKVSDSSSYCNGWQHALRILELSLDTLEVKEVDLEKEIDKIWNPRFNLGWDEKSLLSMNHEGFTTIAKHFYELGLNAQSDKELVEEIYSHIDGIRDTADRMTSGNFMHHRAAIKFSANVIEKVLGLIGLKTQKGE